MVKQFTFLKHKSFWKNSDASGGAQNMAIKECPVSHVLVHSQTKKLGRCWGHAEPEKLLHMIEKNNGIYEVINRFPHKVYFDVDDDSLGEMSELEQQSHLANVLSTIENILPDGDVAVSGSYTTSRVSYHVILNNYTICNEKDRLMIKSIAQQCGYDSKVYTKNRNMKCINQSKDDGRVQAILVNENYKSHMITCFLNDHSHAFPRFAEPMYEHIMIEQAKVVYDVGKLPKYTLKAPHKIVMDELTALDVIALLPINSTFDFGYKHRVARFCFTSEVSFDVYLNWLKKGDASLQKTAAGLKLWNNLYKFPPCNISNMLPILKYYYPSLKKDVHYQQFTDMFTIPENKMITHTRISRLDQCHYNENYKASVFHLGMGCGKTAQTIDYLKTIERFIWIGHRQSLHKGTYQRMLDAGLDCTDYLNGSAANKPLIFQTARQLSICLPSLKHIQSDKNVDVVVIDEIESILDQFTNQLMNENIVNKKKVLHRLVQLIQTARKVIVLDAFITTRTISFLQSIDPSMKIEYIYKDVEVVNTVVFKNYIKDKDENDTCDEKMMDYEIKKYSAVDEICTSLISGKKSFIYYPQKYDMAEFAQTIITKTGKRVIYYNADIDDAIKRGLNEVNSVWTNYDCVITNSVITCGVNYDMLGYDNCWLFFNKYANPREMIQVSARIRHLESRFINVVYMAASWNQPVYTDDRTVMNCKIYDNIYSKTIIESAAPKRKAFEYFCTKAGYKKMKSEVNINTEICQEISQIFSDSNCTIEFDDIYTITSQVEADCVEELIISNDATMLEKLEMQKYYFVKKFTSCVNLQTLGELWDNRIVGFFNKLTKLQTTDYGKLSVFWEISRENGWEYVVPTGDFVTRKKQMELSDALMERIFKEFKFRTMTKLSSKNLIYKYILNEYMGNQSILSELSADKHTRYFIHPDIDDRIIKIRDLIDNHLVVHEE